MNKTLDDIQKKLQNELDCFKQVQEEHHKMLSTRQQLDTQLNENEIIKKELDILKEKNLVYKLVGPVLIKTDQTEAKQNVSECIEYISKGLKRIDDNLTE